MAINIVGTPLKQVIRSSLTQAKEDFGEKYNSLEKRARQQIFTAFRANPNIFGIPTESLGFSQEEYDSAFKLFNRTVVQPIQKDIAEAFQTIFGSEVITFVPFSMANI